jgi:predicted AAA+ superfamily ATPase
MKLIKRHGYLDRLLNVRGTPDIKIIVGVRRGGKSKLLEAFKELLSSESGVNVIYIDLSDLANEGLLEYHALNDYVLSNTKDGVENVLMVDEVQECKGFERTINSLHMRIGCSLFHDEDTWASGNAAYEGMAMKQQVNRDQ